MDIKKFVVVLSGVVLLAFGIGILSLRYNDDVQPITINDGSSLSIFSGDSNVNIGFDGIEVKDGDDHVSIGLNGIYVKDGDDTVNIGRRGIDKEDEDLKTVSADVNLVEELAGAREIVISSSFIDIDIVTEDRDDVGIDYQGRMNTTEIPSLKINRIGRKLSIASETNSPNARAFLPEIIIRVSIPNSFDGDINIATASGDINVNNNGNLGNMKIASSSGGVSLSLGQNPNYNIIGSSASGDFKPTSEMNVTQNSNGIFEAIIGRGENTIEVTTASGNVTFQTP